MSYYIIGSLFALTGAILVSFYSVKVIIRRKIIDQYTALNDVKDLGVLRSEGRIQGTAIVCGGSIAGLWAARVCADHFEDVLIIEPEEWLATEEGRTSRYDKYGRKRNDIQMKSRTRVMQYEQPHVFQPLSFSALKKFYHDIEQEFVQASARILPAWSDIGYKGDLVPGTYPNHYPDGNYPKNIIATRVCFETTLRRLIYRPGGRVRWLSGTVTGMESSKSDAGKVESIAVRTADGDKSIPASLVIDCTGRSQIGMKLIQRWQAKTQPVTEVHAESLQSYRNFYSISVRTACFRYLVPPEMRKRLPIPGGYDNAAIIYTWLGIGTGEKRSTFALNLDGNRIEITCSTTLGGSLPEGPEDLIDWMKSFKGNKPVEQWYLDMISILQENEIDEVLPRAQIQPCYWLHYEDVQNLPYNFIATGDALMCLNPRWGQGCTKACMDALALDRILRSVPTGPRPRLHTNFSKQFFKLQAKRIKSVWDGAKQLDYGLSGTTPAEGETTDKGKFGRIFGTLLFHLAIEGDEQVGFALWRTRMFLAPSTDLLHPWIVLKALFLKLRLVLGFAKPI